MGGYVFDPLLNKIVAISEKVNIDFILDFCANLIAIILFLSG